MKKLYRTFAVSAALLTCVPNAFASKTLALLIPPDFSDWTFQTPMLSTDGGKTGKAMTPMPNKCGWYSYTVKENFSDDVVFFRSNDVDREDLIGLNGNWETGASATPIPLETLFEFYDADTLYFVPDENQILAEGDNGWYTFYPDGVEGICQIAMPISAYPATKTEIVKLTECGSECVTDQKKFASVFGENANSGNCNEMQFVRDASNMWTATYDKRNATCSSWKTAFSKFEGQQVEVHNASLAWMLIDGKRVETTEGNHNGVILNIDAVKGLEDGKTYNLEVFYCDQESSLDNIQLSHNLDLTSSMQNHAGIYTSRNKNANSNLITYDLCYTIVKANSCSLIESKQEREQDACGEDIKDITSGDIKYYLSYGRSLNMDSAMILENGKVNAGGINLTNPYVPKVFQDQINVKPGLWTLFVSIDGNIKKLETFRVASLVNILASAEAGVLDSNGQQLKGLSYSASKEFIAGVPTPIYISTILEDPYGYTYLSIDDAKGASYYIHTNNSKVNIYEKTGDNEYSMVNGLFRTVGEGGVDTLYVYLDSKDLNNNTNEVAIYINGIEDILVNFKSGPILQKAVMAIGSMSKSAPSNKSYAIYNMQGQIVKKGMMNAGEKLTVPTSGTYIVRMGGTSRVMKFK